MSERIKGLLVLVMIFAVGVTSAFAATATYSEYKYNVRNYNYLLTSGYLKTTAVGTSNNAQTIAVNNRQLTQVVGSRTYSNNRKNPSQSYDSGVYKTAGSAGATAISDITRDYTSQGTSYYHKGTYYGTSNVNYANDTTLMDSTLYTASQ